MGKNNKLFFIIFFLVFYIHLFAQSEFGIRLQLDSISCTGFLACYKVQVKSVNGQAWGLAGQNYRLYYDGSLASFQSGRSVLPATYQDFTLIQDIQNLDASGTNSSLPFESSLSFLNYAMDLMDVVNGGISLPANGDWVTTSELCFTVVPSLLSESGSCLEVVWARESLTNEYATSFVEISEWVTTNQTKDALGVLYDDLDASDGDISCLNGYCVMPDTIVVLPGDTCLDANTYELADVKRVEICGQSSNIDLSITNQCLGLDQVNPNYFGMDTVCVVLCDSVSGLEVCDTTRVIIISPPPTDTITTALGDTCLDTNTYQLANVTRVEICESSSHFNLNVSEKCVSLSLVDDTYVGTDTVCVIMCDSLSGMEICDTTSIIVVLPPPIDTIVAFLGDTCLDANTYQLANVTRVEICESSSHFNLNVSEKCVSLSLVDDTYVGTDTVCVVMCDSLSGMEVCDTTRIIVTSERQANICPDTPFIASIAKFVCEQATIELVASEYPGLNVIYSWKLNGNPILNSNTRRLILDTVNLADAGDYEVTVTTDNCTLTSPAYALEVIEKPVLTVAPVPPITCVKGDEDLLLDAIITGGTGSYKYEWVGPNEFYSVKEDPTLINLNETMDGSYTVFATSENGCSPDAFTIEIDITEGIPEPIITSTAPTCEGNQIRLLTQEYRGTEVSYEWRKDGQTLGKIASNEWTIFPATSSDVGDYQVFVEVDGCTNTSDIFDLQIYESPQINIAPIDSIPCTAGFEELTFHTTLSGGTGPFTYNWTGPNGFHSNQQSPELVNIEDIASGTYAVTVTDFNACTAENAREIDIKTGLNQPFIKTNGAVCEGELLTFSTEPYIGTNVLYEWTGPNGKSTSNGDYPNTPYLQINAATEADNGYYTLKVTVDGCTAKASPVEAIVYKKIIANPMHNSGFCQSDLKLFANAILPDSASYFYQWTGPNGFISSEANPVIQNPDTKNEGSYTLAITNGQGCTSDLKTLQVSLDKVVLEQPVIYGEKSICEGEDLLLRTTTYEGQEVEYHWTIVGNNLQTYTTTTPDLYVEKVTAAQAGLISVEVKIGDCTASVSQSELLNIRPLPKTPTLFDNGPICEGEQVELSAELVQNALYKWYKIETNPDGTVSSYLFSNEQNAVYNNLPVGNHQFALVLEQNGCESAQGTITEVSVNAIPSLPHALNNGPLCAGSDLILEVKQPVAGVTYEWFKADRKEFMGTGESLTLENIGEQDAGKYYVLASVGNCITASDEINYISTNVTVENPSKETALLEKETLYTCDNQINLRAIAPQSATGFWSLVEVNSPVTIIAPNSATTRAENLQVGQNSFVWSIESGICGVVSTDTLIVEHNVSPTANNDTFNIDINDVLSLSLLANDENWSKDVNIYILSDLLLGKTVRNERDVDFANSLDTLSRYTYFPNENAVGTEIITYKICNKECPDLCDEATAIIKIGEGTDCFASHLLTPNNDGLNDTFIIPCLGNYEGSSFTVFNRWGDEVYHSDNYQNDWYGTYQDAPLPTGTYYYILNINDSSKSILNGYLFIQR